MTATYNPNLTTLTDQLRFMIGDTAAPFTFQNEELNAVLVKTDYDVYEAALLCCLSGMARSKGSSASRSIGPMSISDESYDRWSALYDILLRAGPDGQSGRGSGLKAVPLGFGYHGSRPYFANTRQLHARIGIHDYVGEALDEMYAVAPLAAPEGGGGTGDGSIHVGPSAPTDTDTLWVDTSEASPS